MPSNSLFRVIDDHAELLVACVIDIDLHYLNQAAMCDVRDREGPSSAISRLVDIQTCHGVTRDTYGRSPQSFVTLGHSKPPSFDSIPRGSGPEEYHLLYYTTPLT
jgi:hypothetical protein